MSLVTLELRVKLHKHFFPINVTVLCRSGGARLCLGSAIAKLSHECPTLRQSEDWKPSEETYWRRPCLNVNGKWACSEVS